MDLFTHIQPCREAVLGLQARGQSVAVVPTMGALHDGHAELMRHALTRADQLIVTIFVNPAQFSPGEDFANYPRTLEADLALCRAAGASLVFAPDASEMYPDACLTSVQVRGLSDGLCGPFRPGHFDGVATVVTKLFHAIPADMALFGEKDYQQLCIIRRLVRDLNIPIEIIGCPTVREPDGLAMSSRNAYLSPPQRAQAASLSAALFSAVQRAAEGRRVASALKEGIRSHILAAGPAVIEYVEVVDEQSLVPLESLDRRARICLAVRIGSCRLIDNVGVDP